MRQRSLSPFALHTQANSVVSRIGIKARTLIISVTWSKFALSNMNNSFMERSKTPPFVDRAGIQELRARAARIPDALGDVLVVKVGDVQRLAGIGQSN
jgi:hypothetical protein